MPGVILIILECSWSKHSCLRFLSVIGLFLLIRERSLTSKTCILPVLGNTKSFPARMNQWGTIFHYQFSNQCVF